MQAALLYGDDYFNFVRLRSGFIFYLITSGAEIEGCKLRGLRKHWAWTSKQYIRTAVTDGIISSDIKIYD